jgi:hypothetical protein
MRQAALCTLHIQLKPPIKVGAGPSGTRVIVEVASMQVKGDRLCGEMVGTASADRLLIGPDGTATLDADGCVTEHIGLVGRASTTYSQPYELARRSVSDASADEWRQVTTMAPSALDGLPGREVAQGRAGWSRPIRWAVGHHLGRATAADVEEVAMLAPVGQRSANHLIYRSAFWS